MKKMMTLVCMLMMLFAFSITANASGLNPSPSGKPTTEENPTEVPSGITSPKTGESEVVLYGLGMTAVVLASGAVIVRKRAM